MMDDCATRRLVRDIVGGTSKPMFVLDAAAITGIGEDCEALRAHGHRLVITPHAGEMATFLDIDREEVLADPMRAASRAAAMIEGVVAMKGACTFICDPSGTFWSCSQGNVGLATSGSGDTLAGIITGLLARGATPLLATQWGVYLHGEAGNQLAAKVGPTGFLARELLAEIPRIMGDLGGKTQEPGSARA